MSTGALVLGLLNGLTIGLLACGFVLVYKANRFLNMAHAQLGVVAAMLLAQFVNEMGWSFWAAMAVCLPLGIATGVVVDRFVVRLARSRTSSPVRLLMLSVGVSQVLLALTFVPWLSADAGSGKSFPQPFSSSVEIGGVVLSGMNLLTLILVPVLMAALVWFLGYTFTGKQIRAASSNPDAARLCGISTNRVSLITWGIAGGLSTISAILNGPTTDATNPAAVGPQLLLFTMGAAAFGAFSSIPAAIGGGLVLGEIYQIVAAETSDAGIAMLTTFGAIVVVLLARGRAIGKVFAVSGAPIPERPAIRIPPTLRTNPLVRHAGALAAVAALVAALLLPHLPYFNSDSNRFLLAIIALYAMVGLALTMLTGWGGQVSLGHFAFVGLGAFLAARWAADGWTLTTLLLVIGVIGAVVSAAVGLPAVRVRGLTLAVTTLGFAVVCPSWLYLQDWIGGDTPFTTPATRPRVAAWMGAPESQLDVYYLVLLVLALGATAAVMLRKSGAGHRILAVRDNERASMAFGFTPMTNKLAILALSGFLTAAAGVLWAMSWQRVSPVQFGPEASIAILAVPIVGGLGSVSGAVGGAVLLFGMQFFAGPHLTGIFGTGNVGLLLFIGGLSVIQAMIALPNGIAGVVQRRWQTYLDDLERRTNEAATEEVQSLPLVVEGVRVRFGGLIALDDVGIELHPGEIVGLIGTNGAGKTTLMNVISGLVVPDQGSIRVFGREVADLPPDIRAGYGVARSFQDASLFSGLTVAETVELAVSYRNKSGMLSSLLGAPWVREADRDNRRRAEEILQEFGLAPWADALAAELSTGTRRICDLAAQVASGPKVLLLDEPTAGVAQREAEAFGPLLRRIRDQLDCTILIIEHDMPLIMDLCDRVYALEVGRVIAEGTPEEIRNDPKVIASYLGTSTVAIERSTRTRPLVPSSRRSRT